MTNHAKQLKAPMQNDTRTAFEKWYGSSPDREIKHQEQYANVFTQARWEAWQASSINLLELLKSEQMVKRVSLKLARKAWGNDDPQMGSPLEVSQRDNAKAVLAAIIEEIRG